MSGFEHPESQLIQVLQARRRAAAAKMRSLLIQLEAAEKELEQASSELSRIARPVRTEPENGDNAA